MSYTIRNMIVREKPDNTMMNQSKYNVTNLTSFKSLWLHKPTKQIRIPTIFEEKINKIAQDIDKGIYKDSEEILNEIMIILEKHKNNERGYKRNSCTLLIKHLTNLIENNVKNE